MSNDQTRAMKASRERERPEGRPPVAHAPGSPGSWSLVVGHWLFPELLLVAAAALLAAVSAEPFAGSSNDGSRLATVECLVDHHTLRIDDSVFVRPPPPTAGAPHPYVPRRCELDVIAFTGTVDKVRVGRHFYSDKPMTPALPLAACYQAAQWAFGLRAAERPDRFCYLMTLLGCGVPFVLAVWCVFRLGRGLGLTPWLGFALAAS